MQDKKAPCPLCPYKLGMIKTVINPCPQCKRNNYLFYRRIKGQQDKPLDIKANNG